MYQKHVYLTTLEQAVIITALGEFGKTYHFHLGSEGRSESSRMIMEATDSIYKKIIQAKHEKINELKKSKSSLDEDAFVPIDTEETLNNFIESGEMEGVKDE